jgi:hypothetical protein
MQYRYDAMCSCSCAVRLNDLHSFFLFLLLLAQLSCSKEHKIKLSILFIYLSALRFAHFYGKIAHPVSETSLLVEKP